MKVICLSVVFVTCGVNTSGYNYYDEVRFLKFIERHFQKLLHERRAAVISGSKILETDFCFDLEVSRLWFFMICGRQNCYLDLCEGKNRSA